MNRKSKQYLILNLLMPLLLIGCSDDSELKLTPLTKNSVILAYGDSLTFGTGAPNPATQSYPAVLQGLTGIKVVNAGVPGEVTATALQRLPSVLASVNPDLVILCHGGNDLIRRLGNTAIKSNLDDMISLIKRSGAEVVLVGVPRANLVLSVPDLYSQLAVKYSIPIDTEILPTILADGTLKSDPIHPNAAGYKLLAEDIYTLLSHAGAL